MSKTIKSLTVKELAAEVKKLRATPAGAKMTSKALQAALRAKGFSFSKEKWSLAFSGGDKKAKAKTPDKKKPVMSVECVCCTSNSDEFMDAVEDAEDAAADFASGFYTYLKSVTKKTPGVVISPDVCPAAHPEVFNILDLACEAGLLEKHIGYSIPLAPDKKKTSKTKGKKAKK